MAGEILDEGRHGVEQASLGRTVSVGVGDHVVEQAEHGSELRVDAGGAFAPSEAGNHG